MTKIVTYDSTLRDGEQSEGITLSLEDKLRIARRLDEFGVDIVEGGFPSSNPKDVAFFREMREHPLKHARIAAFGSTCKKDVPADEDPALAGLVASGAPVVAIVGKAWDAQVERALQTTLDENLRMIRESVAYLKSYDLEVVFDAEHFFDGYVANPSYALECVRAAAEAGADSVDLCDTNGGSLPHQVEAAVLAVRDILPDGGTTRIGIHCHNDSGCAVANTLAAVRAGAVQVQGTINGYGERVGNADLLTVIADLELKLGLECVGPEKLRQLTSVASYVAEICNFSVWTHSPYVGASAFAHKGGLHASAIARFPEAYNHADPDSVGNNARMLVSELAGKASLVSKAAALGFDLSDDADRVQLILDQVKEREAHGYSYEVADGSLALLIARHL
ncbi:MAG: citramalate synthase, partial [Eggerthellaceae bacterium]|nr:citramalate synthase [Eggerthellaceae bacterium]